MKIQKIFVFGVIILIAVSSLSGCTDNTEEDENIPDDGDYVPPPPDDNQNADNLDIEITITGSSYSKVETRYF